MEEFSMPLIRSMLLILALWSGFLSSTANAQDADSTRHGFTTVLLRDEITADRLRPYYPSLTEPILSLLADLRQGMPAEHWERSPEVYRVDNLIYYLFPVVRNADTTVFCFTRKLEGKTWYSCHMENIFIRLDKISVLPASTFPDIREEKYWSGIFPRSKNLDSL
jgi:hypothetical protein